MPTDSRIALKLSHFETQLEDIPLVVQIRLWRSKHVIKALNFLLLLEKFFNRRDFLWNFDSDDKSWIIGTEATNYFYA